MCGERIGDKETNVAASLAQPPAHRLKQANEMIKVAGEEDRGSRLQILGVVREAVDAVMPSIDTNGNRLSQVVQANELVGIDKTKVSQILMNLLSNAGKSTHQGQVTLTLEQTPTRLLIQVTDTGKGIPSHQQDRTFEWFRKAETSDATKYEGSGLGLAISKGFCELMGGTISIESRIDVGSIFTVVIPLPVTSTPEVKKTKCSALTIKCSSMLDSIELVR